MFWRKGKNLAGGRRQRGDPRGGFFRPWVCRRASDGALEAASNDCFCMWHLSAPRSAVCARDFGPSAKAGNGDVARRFPVWAFPFFHPPRAPWRKRTEGTSFRTVSIPADDADASAISCPLVCRQARPARRSGREAKGLARCPAASPVSPEGDHFPRARCERFCVLPSRPAPILPRCNALQCIRGGMGDCRHRFRGRGKWM